VELLNVVIRIIKTPDIN